MSVKWTTVLATAVLLASCGGGDGVGGGLDAGGGATDTDPPAIDAISVAALSVTQASVSWSTDEDATGFVEFGASASYGRATESAATAARAHFALLDSLEDGESYHFRVVSVDLSGNVARSADQTFVQGSQQPDETPPTLSEILVVPSELGAVVSWLTDEPASSSVAYGQSSEYGQVEAGVAGWVTEHRVELSGLAPESTYHFQLTSADAAGNVSMSDDRNFATTDGEVAGEGVVSGSLVQWQPLTVDFSGPLANEQDVSPNPFLDYRFVLDLRGPSGRRMIVPGFFDGDGAGGAAGDVWRARFVVDEPGTWTYAAKMVQGPGVALSLAGNVGAPVSFHGASGSFTVADRDPLAPGFYRYGVLEYAGGHYLKFRDGPHFLKGGSHSPANLLAYAGFDNTVDQPGGAATPGLSDGLHRFVPHKPDFGAGGLGDESDPDFTSAGPGVSSRGIIGALNYLQSAGVNALRVAPMNLGGAGRDTYPYVGAVDNDFDKSHFDLSKLHQWNQALSHAQRRGILLNFTLAESSNADYLDGGFLGAERKLYLREMVARFSHALAIQWTLSEENGFSQEVLEEAADFIDALDPYHRPVGLHSPPLGQAGEHVPFDSVLGDRRFQTVALLSEEDRYGDHVELWRKASESANHDWVVELSGSVPSSEGLTDTNADLLRRTALWDAYLSGAAGIEWGAGQHDLPLGGDLNLEDFRSRASMWSFMQHARSFVEQELPFWEMTPNDGLVHGESSAFGGAEVLAKEGEVYAIYYASVANTGTLDLTGVSGDFIRRWFDPRHGVFVGGASTVTGGTNTPAGLPPGVGGGGEDVFQESGGIVVIEVESQPPSGPWVAETTYTGYSGDSYYRWAGPDSHSSAPGQGRLLYRFEVNVGDNYKVNVHNRHQHPQSDQENDCWMRVDGGSWKKVYSNQGSATIKKWNWHSNFDPQHVNANYTLSAGVHELEIVGRSANFMVDRIHIYRGSGSSALDLGLPESSFGGGGAGTDEDWVLLLER